MDKDFDFLMQLRIDTAAAMKEYKTILERFAAEAAKPIAAPIAMTLDADDVQAGIKDVLKEIKKLAGEIDANERALAKLSTRGQKAMEMLAQTSAKFSRNMSMSLGKGPQAVADSVDYLTQKIDKAAKKVIDLGNQTRQSLTSGLKDDEINKLDARLDRIRKLRAELDAVRKEVNPQNLSRQERRDLVGDIRYAKEQAIEQRAAIRAGDRSPEAKARFRDLKEELEALRIEYYNGQTREGFKEMRRTERGLRRQLRQEERFASVPFGGDVGKVREILRAERQQKQVDRTLARLQTAKAAVQTIGKETTFEQSGDATGLRKQLANNFGILKAFLARLQQLSASVSQEVAKEVREAAQKAAVLDLEVPKADLRQEITTALKGQTFAAQIGADVSFLKASLITALQQITTDGGLFVGLNGVMNGAVRGDAAGRQATEGAEPKRTRAEERVLLADKDRARMAGHSAAEAQKFLENVAKETVTPEFRSSIDALMASRRTGSASEMAAAAGRGIEAVPALMRGFAEYQASDADDTQKELMNSFKRGFVAEFVTPLVGRLKEVETRGPSANPRGRLAGVDFGAQELAAQIWQARAGELIQQSRAFDARLGQYGVVGTDPKQAEKAVNNFVRALDRANSTAREFADAPTLADKDRAGRRYSRAQGALRVAENDMAQALLEGRGDVQLGTTTFRKDLGFMAARRMLQERLGTGLDAANAARYATNPGAAPLRLAEFAAGALGGNADMARELAKAAGASEEVLADQTKIAALVEEQFGDLRQVLGVYEAITQELKEQAQLVQQGVLTRQREAQQRRTEAQERGMANRAAAAERKERRAALQMMQAMSMNDQLALFGGVGAKYVRNRVTDPSRAFDLALEQQRVRDERARRRAASTARQIQGTQQFEAMQMDAQLAYQRYGAVGGRYAKTRVVDVDRAMEEAYARERRLVEREVYRGMRAGLYPSPSSPGGPGPRFTRARQDMEYDAYRMNEAWEYERWGGVGRRYSGRVEDVDTARYLAMREERARRGRASMAGFGDTLRSGLAMFGGIGIGYTAVNSIRNQMRTYMQYEQELANIQGVLGMRDRSGTETLSAGIAQTAARYGANLLETAQAAKVLAQAGLEANEVIQELDTTMAAMRGMGMTVEQVQELQVAVRAVTADIDKYNEKINYTVAVLDKVSAVEAKYAVSSQDLAGALQILSPLMDNFSANMVSMTDAFDYTIALTTVMVERLRITGTQAANILKFTFSRLARPEILGSLQKDFGLNIGDAETGDYLPLDRLVQELGVRYAQLGEGQGGAVRQQQFAVQLSGGRNVVGVTTILEEYARVAEIARRASLSFGDTQRRALIGMDTMATSTERLKTNFSLFTRSLLDTSGAAAGFRLIMDEVSESLANFSGAAGGVGNPTGGLLATILFGGAGLSGLRAAYRGLANVAKNGGLPLEGPKRLLTTGGTVARVASTAGTAVSFLTGALGTLARVFTPGGLLLAGGIALVGLIGRIAQAGQEATDTMAKYRISLRDLTSEDFATAPQYVQLLSDLSAFKIGGADPVAGQNQLLSYLTGEGADILRAQQGVLGGTTYDELLGMSEKDYATWETQNLARLRTFSKTAALELVKSLSANNETARALFAGMETDGERVATVVRMVGNAAWVATYQMQAAISDLSDATTRMSADAIKAMDDIDKKRRTLLPRIGNYFAGLFGGRVGTAGDDTLLLSNDTMRGAQQVNGYGPAQLTDAWYTRGIGEAVQQLRDQYGDSVPGLSQLLSTPAAQEAMRRVLPRARLGRLATGRESVGLAALRDEVLAVVAGDEALVQQVAREIGEQMVLDSTRGTRLGTVVRGQIGVTEDTLTPQQRITAIINTAGEIAKDLLRKGNEALLELDRGARTLAQPYGDGTSVDIMNRRNRERSVFARFEDALFDLVTSLYEAAQSIERDALWAGRTFEAYDRNAALIQLGRTAFDAGTRLRTTTTIDLARVAREVGSIADLEIEVQDAQGNRKPADKAKLEEYDARIRQLRKALVDLDTVDLAAQLGPSAEGAAILEDFRRLQTVLSDGGAPKNLLGEVLALFQRIGESAAKTKFEFAQQARNLELAKEQLQRMADLQRAQLSVTSLNAENLRISLQSARDQYAVDRLLLKLRFDDNQISKEVYAEESRRLTAAYEFNQVMTARIALAEAERALQEQTKSNLDGMLSGVRNSFTDLSIWEAILNPEGDTAEERARNKAMAVKNIIFNTLNPLAKTLTDRFVNNGLDAVTESLLEFSAVGKSLSLPEQRLKAEVRANEMLYESVMSSGAAVASMWYDAITTAGAHSAGLSAGGGGRWAPGMRPRGPVPTLEQMENGPGRINFGDVPVDPLADQIDAEMRRYRRDSMILGAGTLVGTMGGTVLGGGGQMAQLGSTLGTTAGMAGAYGLSKLTGGIGTFFGGPVGTAVGAAVGGLLGGLIGGNQDRRDQTATPVVRGLDAIERAQRETIATIASQTDALLKPENRFLNLPSTFAVPGYAPNFASQAGLQVVEGDVSVTVNVTTPVGGNPTDLEAAVQRAVGNALADQRRNRSWSR